MALTGGIGNVLGAGKIGKIGIQTEVRIRKGRLLTPVGEHNLLQYNGLTNNRILYDQYEIPGVYVFIPKFNWDPENGFNSSEVHPAFIWDGVEHDGFWVSKYQNTAVKIIDGSIKETPTASWDITGYIAASIPFVDPITYVSLDDAKQLCWNKNSSDMIATGNCFHLMTNAERAAIALWTYQMVQDGILQHMPYGNNNYCRDVNAKGIVGIPLNPALTIGSNGGTYGPPYYGRWRTGSGGPKTAHNLDLSGVFDLNGNVWEWIDGARLVDGEIQIIENNDAALGRDTWAAIDQGGNLVTPGSTGTLKYDITGADDGVEHDVGEVSIDISISNYVSISFAHSAFKDMQYGIASVPSLVRKLALVPLLASDQDGCMFVRNSGVRVVSYGGHFYNGLVAGLHALHLLADFTTISLSIGFRSCYIGDISAVT